MQVRTRMCMSADGYVTTPDGLPAQLADPAWSPQAFGFVEFQESCDAVLMGRTTFEPALGADEWPWSNLEVSWARIGLPALPTTWSSTATPQSCWRSSVRRTRAATSTSSAALARSRPS